MSLLDRINIRISAERVMSDDGLASRTRSEDTRSQESKKGGRTAAFLHLRFTYKQGLHQQRQRLQTRWNPRPQPPNPRQAAFCTGLFCFD